MRLSASDPQLHYLDDTISKHCGQAIGTSQEGTIISIIIAKCFYILMPGGIEQKIRRQKKGSGQRLRKGEQDGRLL